jgi:hypothetical protein
VESNWVHWLAYCSLPRVIMMMENLVEWRLAREPATYRLNYGAAKLGLSWESFLNKCMPQNNSYDILVFVVCFRIVDFVSPPFRILKWLLISCLAFSQFIGFGFCNHCNLACFICSSIHEHSSWNHMYGFEMMKQNELVCCLRLILITFHF